MVVDRASLVAVDTDQPPESLALIGCGVTTGLSTALNRTVLSPGDSLAVIGCGTVGQARSEGHTSELQSLMRISYAVFCLKKKNKHKYNKQADRTAIKQS